mmetsp:Transcript_10365/g.14376  ORF Transcript_10365/g.14376 Transcript_10365/m.14376 type:complete len:193 (+) Transcript_10365:302-880(+)
MFVSEFFTINWFSGIIECMFAGFGLASIRSNLGFRAHWLRCYFWYCLASFIVDVLIIILFYSGVYTIESEWQRIAFQVVSFVGICVYISGFWFGRKLWLQLLEIIRSDIEGAMHMGHQPGAGGVLGVTPAYPVHQGTQADAYPLPAQATAAPAGADAQQATASPQPDSGVVEAVPVAAPHSNHPYMGTAHRL